MKFVVIEFSNNVHVPVVLPIYLVTKSSKIRPIMLNLFRFLDYLINTSQLFRMLFRDCLPKKYFISASMTFQKLMTFQSKSYHLVKKGPFGQSYGVCVCVYIYIYIDCKRNTSEKEVSCLLLFICL